MPDNTAEEARAPLPESDTADPTPEAAESECEPEEESLTGAASLWRIRRILDHSRDITERDAAVALLLPLLWDRLPWRCYSACCALTTRMYLPYGLHLPEWMSFPRVFARNLRRHHTTLPATHEERRRIVAETLVGMLQGWNQAYLNSLGTLGTARGRKPPSEDVGVDLCEAVGRLNIYEAERKLLTILHRHWRPYGDSQVRLSVLIALATLPPARIPNVWAGLREGSPAVRHPLASILAYTTNPDTTPFLLEVLPHQGAPYLDTVAQPLLLALGTIGDLRALPVLNAIARDEPHPQRPYDPQNFLLPTARKAIERLMKQAEGHEEVTLLRASDLATLDHDVLLRGVESTPDDPCPQELLRATVGNSPVPTAPDSQAAPDGAASRELPEPAAPDPPAPPEAR